MNIVVETVIPLSPDQKKRIAALLEKKFNTKIFIETLNLEILGGIRVTVDSMQYDASILGKISQLRSA